MVMVLGVVFFIWYRSIQAPALLGLLPEGTVRAGYIDTRNIIKKAFKSGASPLDSLSFPQAFSAFFSLTNAANDPGINLYSELVFFETNDSLFHIFVKLANNEKWESFLNTHKTSLGFAQVDEFEDIKYCMFDSFPFVAAWRGKHLSISFYEPTNHSKPNKFQLSKVLNPDSYDKALEQAFKRLEADIFYENYAQNHFLAVYLLAGKARFEYVQETRRATGEMYTKQTASLKAFDALSTKQDYIFCNNTLKTSSTTADALFFTLAKNSAHKDTARMNIQQSVLSLSKACNSSQIEPAYASIKNENPFIIWDISCVDTSGFGNQLAHDIPTLNRMFVYAITQNQSEKLIGTTYFSEENLLPIYPLANFILSQFKETTGLN